MKHLRLFILVTVVAYFLLSAWVAGAGDPAFGTYAFPPPGCVTWRTWEDGSAIAICNAGQSLMLFDPDGQPYANAAGVPVREPGWYEYSGPMMLLPNADWRRELG